MTQPVIVVDEHGDRPFDSDAMPLNIGGSNSPIEIPGCGDDDVVARIGFRDAHFFVTPTTTDFPVLHNGRRISSPQWLQNDDVLRLGSRQIRIALAGSQLTVQVAMAGRLAATAPPGEEPVFEAIDTEPVEISPLESAAAPDITGAAEAQRVEPVGFKPTEIAETGTASRIRVLPVVVGSVLMALVFVAWYMFTARAVLFAIQPQADLVEIDGGLLSIELGGRYLLRPGEYTLHASLAGYHDLEASIEVTREQNQTYAFELKKLPGKLTIRSEPVSVAVVMVDGVEIGETPLVDIDVEAGTHQFVFRADRYLEHSSQVDVEGMGTAQAVDAKLEPAWAVFSLSSNPPGATILIDGNAIGDTPMDVEILQGNHEISLTLSGYKSWYDNVTAVAGGSETMPVVTMAKSDGMASIRSQPGGASVTIDGVYRGQTPLRLALAPGKTYVVKANKAGYETTRRQLAVRSGEDAGLLIRLTAITGSVMISSNPDEADVFIDGRRRGTTTMQLELPATEQLLEFRKPGYAPYHVRVTPRPGYEQRVNAVLKTLEQAKWEAIPPLTKTSAGQELKLVRGGQFQMGASRREPGRRANEVIHPVQLTRGFYIALKEVTNKQFREFDGSHSSGMVKRANIDQNDHPVANVTWDQAASYCNWLSAREKLPPAYVQKDGRMVAVQPMTMGYRLPTEAEWAMVGRFAAGRAAPRYAWGAQLPPPKGSGNIADVAARSVARNVLDDYDAGWTASAPVGSFDANPMGLFDIGGNVAEWVHDYYEVPSPALKIDPMGPITGEYHVIRGSSWMHGTVTELRLSYRDYSQEARPDLGFRIGRYVE